MSAQRKINLIKILGLKYSAYSIQKIAKFSNCDASKIKSFLHTLKKLGNKQKSITIKKFVKNSPFNNRETISILRAFNRYHESIAHPQFKNSKLPIVHRLNNTVAREDFPEPMPGKPVNDLGHNIKKPKK